MRSSKDWSYRIGPRLISGIWLVEVGMEEGTSKENGGGMANQVRRRRTKWVRWFGSQVILRTSDWPASQVLLSQGEKVWIGIQTQELDFQGSHPRCVPYCILQANSSTSLSQYPRLRQNSTSLCGYYMTNAWKGLGKSSWHMGSARLVLGIDL